MDSRDQKTDATKRIVAEVEDCAFISACELLMQNRTGIGRTQAYLAPKGRNVIT